MSYVLGIDCGTTHTAAAIARDGTVEVLRLGTQRAELPSLVFVAPDGRTVIGNAAARRGEGEPGRLAREFKRRIGDPVPILVGGSPFSAHALTARVLEQVLLAAGNAQGGPPSSVVLTCPANWGPYKRDLLLQAARLADLPPAALRTEPEAAAIEHAAGSRVRDGDVIAVYDLGGGTFDAAVLRRTPGGFEVLGQPEGIEQLGGMDFDEAVFEHVLGSLPPEKLGSADDPEVRAALTRLRRDCVEAKEALSEDTEVLVPVALPRMHTRVRLTRAEFEAMIRPSLADTVGAMRRALRSAEVPPEQVSAILLSGGSSRVPLVAQLLSTEFGRPVVLDPHPEHSIALGAARAAAQSPAPPPPEKPRQGTTYGKPRPAEEETTTPVKDARTTPVHPSDAPTAMFRAAPEPTPPPTTPNTDDSPVLLTRAGLDLTKTTLPPPVPPAETKNRRGLVIGAAAGAVLLAIGAVVFFVWRNAGDGEPAANPKPSPVVSASTFAAPTCGWKDDFEGGTLDTAWERTQPGAALAVGGGGVTLDAPDGADIYADHTAAPMLLRKQSGDFTIETEVTLQADQWYQGAGLIVWNSQTSFVRLERGFGNVGAIVLEYRDGGRHVKLHPPSKGLKGLVRTDAQHVVLQLRREGDTVHAAWREAGQTGFRDLGDARLKLPDSVRTGVSVLNRAQNGTEPESFSARFESASLTC